MDKLYKPHYLSQLKARMAQELPVFKAHKVPPVGHPSRSRFVGSHLYVKQLPSKRCIWLEWFPCEGVDREFFAFLGWSLDIEVLPVNQPGDVRIYEWKGPVPVVPCGTINVQQIEGRQAITGFNIPTPWDQLYKLSPRASEAERKMAMDKAHAEYLAVTEAQRIEAVRQAMNEAFTVIHTILPEFEVDLHRIQ